MLINSDWIGDNLGAVLWKGGGMWEVIGCGKGMSGKVCVVG